MRKTIKQVQGESDYWRVKFINEQKRAEAAEVMFTEALDLLSGCEIARKRLTEALNEVKLYRPATAVNLAELVPDESALADKHIEWLSTLQRPMFSDEDWEELTLYTWLAFRDSARVQRAAILRNIEALNEAKS